MVINGLPVDEESERARVLGLSAPVRSLEAFLLGKGVQGVLEYLSGGAVGIFWRFASLELENCDFGGHVVSSGTVVFRFAYDVL